jgi:DNA polymerase-3 subunit delta
VLDSYPLVDYTLRHIQQKLQHSTRYKFIADRYFKYSEVRQIINNGNLFGDTTYIEISYKTKPTIEHQNELISIINTLDSHTTLIINTDKLNKKDYTAAWVKLIASVGWVLNVGEDDSNTIIRYQLQLANLSITKRALDCLGQLNQANTSQLLQTITHLTLLYPEGHEISEDDVKQNSIDSSQYNIYQLSHAYLEGDILLGLKILDNIYQKPEDAILILWLLADDVKKLIRLKASLKQKLSFSQIAEELRIWGNLLSLWQNAERRLNYATLVELLDDLANLDMMIKGVLNGNVQQQLTNLIIKLCKGQ